MRLNTTFRKISKQFMIDFNEIAPEILHNPTAGEEREKALIRVLSKYLPQRVRVDRGFVIDVHGNESKQIDVIIYDSTVGTIFRLNDTKYFPCETVIAVGEVKSDIRSTRKLQDALDKIKSVKMLDRSNNGRNTIISGPGVSLGGIRFDPLTQHRDQIFGFIFTTKSMKQKSIINYLQHYNKITDRRFWLNLFCDCDKSLISYECQKALCSSAMDANGMYCTTKSEVPDLLLLFYSILATFVEVAHVARPDYFSYAQLIESEATYHSLVSKNRKR